MKYFSISDNASIPALGLGTWKSSNGQVSQAVSKAIEIGYRHIDCASIYQNQKEIGTALTGTISSGQVKRDDLWITSKLWNNAHAKKHVQPALERTLKDLQLDYLDLYLIHFPIAQPYVAFEDRYPAGWFLDPDAIEPKMELAKVPLHLTWEAMEQQHDAGLTHRIGVCNYNTALIGDLLSYARIKPSMLQIESHPYLTQEKLIRLCQLNDISVTAFSPLGALSYLELDMAAKEESVLEQPSVVNAAKRLNRTPAQVVLRWGIQRGTAIIPKTSKESRMIENASLFDFELNAEEMSQISALNRNRRFNDPGDFCEAAFNRFNPIYD